MKLETIVLDDYISVVEKDHVDKLIAMLNEYHSGNQRDILTCCQRNPLPLGGG